MDRKMKEVHGAVVGLVFKIYDWIRISVTFGFRVERSLEPDSDRPTKPRELGEARKIAPRFDLSIFDEVERVE